MDNVLTTESILLGNQNNSSGVTDSVSSLSGGCADYATVCTFTGAGAFASAPAMTANHFQDNTTDTITSADSANNVTATDMTTFTSIKTEIDDNNLIMLPDTFSLINTTQPIFYLQQQEQRQEAYASPSTSSSYSTVTSNTPSSSIDFYYDQDTLHYFMTTTTAHSPATASLLTSSFTPAPSLSPEITNLTLYPIDNSNTYCDYYTSATSTVITEVEGERVVEEEQQQSSSIKTEPSCVDIFYEDNYLLLEPTATVSSSSKSTIATTPCMNNSNNDKNFGFSSQQQQIKKRPTKKRRQEPPESTCSSSVLSDNSNNDKKKIFPCNYCDRSFARSYDASRHTRVHTGNKPYVCPCCSKGFSRSDARVRHFRTELECRDGPKRLAMLNASASTTKKRKH